MLALGDGLVGLRKGRNAVGFLVGSDEKESRGVAFEVHAFQSVAFVAEQIKNQEIKRSIEVGPIEDCGERVGCDVVFLYELGFAERRRFEWASVDALVRLPNELLAHGDLWWQTFDFEKGVLQLFPDDRDIEAQACLTILAALVEEVWPGFNQDAFPAQSLFEIRGDALL